MEAGILLRPIWSLPKQPLRFHRGTPPNFPRFVKASLNSLPVTLSLSLSPLFHFLSLLSRASTMASSKCSRRTTPEFRSRLGICSPIGWQTTTIWLGVCRFTSEDSLSSPYYSIELFPASLLSPMLVGQLHLACVFLGSSQSRADLLALGLSVTNILAGLVWLSIRPKSISKVDPEGVECRWISPYLPDTIVSELEWFWQSLSAVTCCRSLVIVYDGICVLQVGVAAESSSGDVAETVDASKLIQGALYTGLMKSGAQSYLANLSLYPGKAELPFLPPNTQAVILQPLGDKGIAVIGGDTIRGFTTADQAWISLIGDKLDATLMKSLTKTEFLTQNTG